jgi:ribosomal protein L37AE/L43A
VLSHWFVFLLAIFATHRVTRLLTRDQMPLIAVPREAFAQRWAVYEGAKTAEQRCISLNGKRTNIVMRSLAYLWECDWCMSVWVGAAIAYGTYHWINAWAWQVALLGATASTITGLIAQREPD